MVIGTDSRPLPLVSVVICHHRGRTLLERCLASVATSQGVQVQTVIVTSDVTYDDPASEVYYLQDGPAAKRNLGVAHAQAEQIAFLDDDVEISPYCLYELRRWMVEHPWCGMAFAKILNMERRREFDDCGSWLTWTGFLWARSGNHQEDHGQFDRAVPILASKSATCIVRRDSFYAAGGFDADYFILGEDTDLPWRMWLTGCEVWYIPAAVSWHAFGCESLKPKQEYYTLTRIHRLGCRNYLKLLTTNLSLRRFVYILPIHLLGWLWAALGYALRGDVARAYNILAGMWDWLMGLPASWRKRHALMRRKLVLEDTIWPLISHSPPLVYYLARLLRYWTTQQHG